MSTNFFFLLVIVSTWSIHIWFSSIIYTTMRLYVNLDLFRYIYSSNSVRSDNEAVEELLAQFKLRRLLPLGCSPSSCCWPGKWNLHSMLLWVNFLWSWLNEIESIHTHQGGCLRVWRTKCLPSSCKQWVVFLELFISVLHCESRCNVLV